MSFQEKLNRLRELNAIAFSSDEELKERSELIVELDFLVNSNQARKQNNQYIENSELKESKKNSIDASLENKSKEIFNQVMEENKQVDKPQKVYRGIISGRIEKYLDERRERNRATPEMIEQLQLDFEKERLKAKIAVMKKIQKENKTSRLSNLHLPNKIFIDEIPEQKTSKKKKARSAYQHMEDNLRKSLGTNDKDYSQVIGSNKEKNFNI